VRIAMLSSEITPFAKTGGLADVIGTLAPALERAGHELTLIMPAHRSVLRGYFALDLSEVAISALVGGAQLEAPVLRSRLGKNISVFFVRADEYFDREYLYGTAQADYADNAERFVFFCRAALEVLRRYPVDIVHAHDWQAALAPVFLKLQSESYPEIASAKTVFTIHNLGFQGIFDATHWPLLNLPASWFTPAGLEFYARINFLKGALLFSDKITTVSPTYAREIMTPEQGFGLDGVLRGRASDVIGILNGIDYQEWNPQADPAIACQYTVKNLAGKTGCKQELQAFFQLPQRPDVPLLGVVSRLTAQKGFELIQKIWPELMQQDLQFVLLGTGEARFVEFFTQAATLHPEKASVHIGFDEKLAHRIEAGADIFLMPSLYEPCGLNQMFSLRYGTIPIVRAVGGLNDSVENYDAEKATGTGFTFVPYEPEALNDAVERALHAFANERAWTALKRRAMKIDNSWDRSAAAYSTMYRDLFL